MSLHNVNQQTLKTVSISDGYENSVLNCIHQTWAEPCFVERISHICGIFALQVSYFLVDEVTLFLTHTGTVTVPLYEITGMCRH